MNVFAADSENEGGHPTQIVEEGDKVSDGVGEYDKSKTATDLYNNRYSDVTLSIPGEVETLATDIVFVIDKSSSDKLSSDFANGLFEQLIEVQKVSGASIKVGVVIYNFDGHVALPLTELTEDNYKTLLDSLPKFSGGTNADAGLILAKDMLDADEAVDASRKHVILIGDGLNWAFDVNGAPHTVLLKKDANATNTLYGAGTTTWLEGRNISSSYSIPKEFASWEAYWAAVVDWVENDGDRYVFDITNYNGANTEIPNPDYNSIVAVESAVPCTEVLQHALNMDRALYDTWESYTALQNAGYSCNAYYTGSSTSNIGYNLMKMLAGTSTMDFEDIKYDILYSVSKGSTVVDYIGYSADPEEGYDFDFVNEAGKIALTVGDKVYVTAKVENTNVGVTSTYSFTAPGAEEATFLLEYYKGNGTTEEHFVWIINENVSKFAPVSLQYTLDLVERSEIPGWHENVDTNQKATLYPKNSDGENGTPEEFEKPKVKYEISALPIDVILGGEKFLDGVPTGGYRFELLKDGEVIETVTSDADGLFAFSALTYDKADVFEYEIREVIGSDETIIYDDSVYTVIVNIMEEDHVLSALLTYTKDDLAYESEIQFNNETVETTEATTESTEESTEEETENFEEETDVPLGDKPVVDETPETGDASFVWVLAAVISCMSLVALPILKKRKMNE